jgi:hypothetical protein
MLNYNDDAYKEFYHRPVFHLKLNSTQLNSTQIYRFVRTSQETY